MPRKSLILVLALILLAAGQALWSAGQSADIFAPVDLLVEQKRFEEAIDLLRRLLISNPKKTEAIKRRIGDVLLKKADDNIQNQRYNEAFEDATRFWRENPQRADEAQKRIKKINEVREKYNAMSRKLYDYIVDEKNRADPAFNTEVVKRLQELDELDRNNPDSKKTINYLKETSLALVNQDTLKRLMSEARVLIDSGRYLQAMRKYTEGFGLFKPEFDYAGYDEITLSAVSREAGFAKAAPDSYAALQNQLDSSINALRLALESGKIDSINAAIPAAESALAQLENLRSGLFSAAARINAIYQTIPKTDHSPIEYQYLAVLDVLIRGRSDNLSAERKPSAEHGLPEGLGGVLIAQWDALLGGLDAAAQAGLDAAYAAGETAYAAGDLSNARSAYDRAAALYTTASYVLSWRKTMPQSDFVPDLSAIRSHIAAAASADARLKHEAQTAQAASRLASLIESLRSVAAKSAAYASAYTSVAVAVASETTSPAESSANEKAVATARSSLESYRTEIRTIEDAIAAEARRESELAALAKTAAAGGESRAETVRAAYAAKLAAARDEALGAEYDTATAIFRIEGGFLEQEIAAREKAVAAAEALIEGTVSTRPDRVGFKDPSPSTASTLLQAELQRLQALSSWAGGSLARADAENSALRGRSDFAAARTKIKAVVDRTSALQKRREASLARAEERKKYARDSLENAKRSLDSADSKLANAKNLIKLDKGTGARTAAVRKEFADALSLVGDATELVLASANADFIAATWDEYQKRISETRNAINLARNDFVVDETFRLLGEGQKYYDQTLFDLAAESLNSAQEIWYDEFKAEQEQVKYWQNLVRQASDTNNKREVRQGDALYYEISNYLSEARKSYLRGADLKKSGDEAGAAAAFNTAKQNLAFVTRAFPLNAEAGLLNLQILKATDTEAYRLSLPRRVSEAIALLDTDPASGYSRIADLYKMEPSYPGLKAALEKAEVAVGRRLAPLSKEQLAQAASLVAQAEKLLTSGRKDDQAEAEKRLNAALNIDKTNKKALALLREINILKGKEADIVLGIADRAILDQATREYAARRYNQARDTLNRLLSDPNKRSREVLRLDNELKVLGYP
jgi:hypothetical protein